MAVLAVSALFASAQNQLPLNPAVRSGKLPNGLSYYILHNEEPKERVNFYIAQKVGSTLETPEQLGLAHFLEHMAFNGTKHYPGKAMLNYLQSKGIRFGADINAYTGFDETVYNIDNVPSADKALIDSVLLVLYDWSGSLLLEDDEINAERGVIEEEWRMRNNAQQRMFEAALPHVYKEYQYQQMPIGKMDIVRNFAPETLRAYYHKWYRPDQQGIVIVGDIDAAELEKKVVDLFSDIPMPENAAPREYPNVSDNQDPIYFYYKDKELQFPLALLSFKSDKIPFEMRNTDMAWIQTELLQVLIETMINNRLDEYAQKTECKYAQAGVSFGDFLVSKTKDAFDIQVITKDDVRAGFEDALAIVARACKTGFTESELVRARDQILSNYEKAYNERNNTKNSTLARQLIRHFIDNDPNPGIEKEYQMMQQMIPMIPVQAINELSKEILTSDNAVLIVGQPERDNMVEVTSEEMLGTLAKSLGAEYEAYVDEVITDPLISQLPTAGKIKSEQSGQFGTTVLTLSNGVKVIVKPTDFKQDEILMTAFKEGGKRSYPTSMASNILLAEDAYSTSKLGNFNQITLTKYLAGKNVNLSYSIGNTANTLDASSTVKDLPTLMEMIYASFTQLGSDQAAYDAQIDQAKAVLKATQDAPQSKFSQALMKTNYGNNPMFQIPTVELVESGNYEAELALVKASLANAADYTFIFTGNVDLNTLKPLLEQYIASLPSTGTASKVDSNVSSIEMVKGVVDNTFTLPMQAPSTMIYTNANGYNLEYNIENSVKVDLLGDILSNVYTDTLREEEGGTYSPYAYGMMNPYTGQWSIISVIQTNDQVQQKIMTRATDEFNNLLKNGVSEEHFNKAREAMLKQYDIQVRNNKYWLNNLMKYERGIDDITSHKAAIENLTLADFNKFISGLYDGKNYIQVVMQGVPM